MRKLFTTLILGTVMIGSLTTVGGCPKSTKRFKKPTLSDYFRNQFIFQLKNHPEFGGKNFGDVWKDSDLTKLAIRLINQVISQYFYGSSFKTWAAWTGLNKIDQPQKFFTRVFRNWLFSIATDQLYRKYLNVFADDSYLETQRESNEGVYFDPVPNSAQHHHQGLDWVVEDVPYYQVDGSPLDYARIPNSFKKSRPEIKKILEDPQQIGHLKQALTWSFRERFNYTLVPQVIDQIISPVFLRYKSLAQFVNGTVENSKVFIDRYSSLFSTMMNWSILDLSNPNIKSNFLMVWEYQVKSQYINQINRLIRNYSQAKSVLTGDGWNPTAYNQFILKMHNIDPNSIVEYNHNGSDPVFGIPHFKGFCAYDNSDKIINKFNADLYKTELRSAAKAGFLSPDGFNFAFLKETAASYATFAFALPIYIPDILSAHNPGSSLNFGPSKSGAIYNKKIELKNYYNGEVNPESLSWAGLGSSRGRSIAYLANLKDHTSKPEATFGTYAADGKTNLYTKDGVINPKVEWTNFNLLKWAIYSFGQSNDITKIAKKRFYSIAFNYNRDNLYSQKLNDEIGQYIEEKN